MSKSKIVGAAVLGIAVAAGAMYMKVKQKAA